MDRITYDSTQGLLKKLSAVRMTLSDDERAVLDRLLLGKQMEVMAHRLTPSPDERLKEGADEVIAHRLTPSPDERLKEGADEVMAHRLTPSPDERLKEGADEVMAHRLNPAPDERFLIQDADEVMAHRLTPSPDERLKERITSRVTVQIIYDNEREVYRLV